MDTPTPSLDTRVHIALALRELLKHSGYVEWQLAHALSVDITTVIGWLSGDPIPRAHAEDLAFTLGVSVQHMIERERYLDYEYQRQEKLRRARYAAELRAGVPHTPQVAPVDPQAMLRAAGMVRTDSRAASVIYYCLSCNRGLGRNGTQHRTRRVLAPSARRCHYCHGSMLAEECLSGTIDRQYHRYEGVVAA